MLEAALSAVPLLFPAFAVLGALFGTVMFRRARRQKQSALAPVLWAVALAGEVAVTLTPTAGGASGSVNCTVGAGSWEVALGQQGLLNLALYVPLAAFGVWAFRRPLSVPAGCVVLSSATELLQTVLGTGRACDAADFVDNSAGALLGTVLATGALALAGRRPLAVRRDGVRALTAAGGGLSAVAVAVWLFVPLYDETAARAPFSGSADVLGPARQLADGLFGPGSRVETTSAVADPALSRFALTEVVTDRGRFRFEERSGSLVSVEFADPGPAGASPLPEEQLLRAGGEFAAVWFPDLASGVRPVLAPGPDADGSRVLSYRRPDADGAQQPGRLDVTVSASGRVRSATAARPR
ncbi:VanZ family protein [Kitasatospora sp. YST-16]|uniref:VanZ family protein n=1 Tax=Kitasatospora sp. YST-16 TaxID=2998080 RepID=UPI002283B12B|nr:VanZ family protein [Kitasatospora sp. YST-16]WAL75876.1 VanZ family protein [Kitasatospora sp. YST-16]WNW41937.1 VanZ family protein [Streptomyces sp. Li-HN-5-13]